MLRRLLFAVCVDDGVVPFLVLLRVLPGVVEVTARLTGVRRRFGEVVADEVAAVRFGDFLPVEKGAVDAASDTAGVDTAGFAVVVVVVLLVFAADPN